MIPKEEGRGAGMKEEAGPKAARGRASRELLDRPRD
jgi:hypothetical protein